MSRQLYSPAWRRAVRRDAQRSAKVLAQVLVDVLAPTSVLDVGCGEGQLVDELRELGVDAAGIDGEWVDGVEHVDLAHPPYPARDRVSVVTCLEVAEHLPLEVAEPFVGWLCTLAPVVVFGAAIPGQGGQGHVNEQWQSWWARQFEARGYSTFDPRGDLWASDVAPWYAQNTLVYIDPRDLASPDVPIEWANRLPLDLVHPGIWSVYR